MMSLEGTKTINERGKGVGLFFVMKDTGWKKHHQKGRLFWENTKNIHELRVDMRCDQGTRADILRKTGSTCEQQQRPSNGHYLSW